MNFVVGIHHEIMPRLSYIRSLALSHPALTGYYYLVSEGCEDKFCLQKKEARYALLYNENIEEDVFNHDLRIYGPAFFVDMYCDSEGLDFSSFKSFEESTQTSELRTLSLVVEKYRNRIEEIMGGARKFKEAIVEKFTKGFMSKEEHMEKYPEEYIKFEFALETAQESGAWKNDCNDVCIGLMKRFGETCYHAKPSIFLAGVLRTRSVVMNGHHIDADTAEEMIYNKPSINYISEETLEKLGLNDP